MPISKSLTTKEVARLCSVSDATVKRWDDAGVLKSERTSGGHRRFRAEEVARFQLEQDLGLKKSHGDESINAAVARRRPNKNLSDCSYFRALVAGCEEEAANLLINYFLHEKNLSGLFDDLLAPAMRKIGELWVAGELTVAQEHLATRTAISSLYKLRCVVPVCDPNGKTAVCCAIEGDFHELPTHLAQIIFESEGWDVVNFGANLPLYSLTEEISHLSPKLICISSTIMADIERLSRDYKDFSESQPRRNASVVLGGRGFQNPGIRRRLPAELYPENFTQLSEFVRNLS
ncbi:MAG: B12-binding domain-containing protein [Pyrinomonadaceae bacterium]